MILRYFYGWYHFFRYIKLARAKKHGAGKQSWANAYKGGTCARWIIDGQHRQGRFPRWLKIKR